MPTKTKENIIYDKILSHFNGVVNEMVHAINVQIKHQRRDVLSTQAINNWRDSGVPLQHVVAVELATGGAIKRKVIRPELYE